MEKIYYFLRVPEKGRAQFLNKTMRLRFKNKPAAWDVQKSYLFIVNKYENLCKEGTITVFCFMHNGRVSEWLCLEDFHPDAARYSDVPSETESTAAIRLIETLIEHV